MGPCSKCGSDGKLSRIGGRVFCGKCSESALAEFRAHIAHLARSVLVTTTEHLHGYRVVTYLGTVWATPIASNNMVRDIGGDFADFMGHTSGQEKALMALHREAEHRLRLAAAARNAHAVIGTRFDVEIIETTDDRGILQTRDRKPPAPEQPETD